MTVLLGKILTTMSLRKAESLEAISPKKYTNPNC